jgi:NAD(P)-dependent dehydrogenase (short-subunit alcohol dehydrogenase family)
MVTYVRSFDIPSGPVTALLGRGIPGPELRPLRIYWNFCRHQEEMARISYPSGPVQRGPRSVEAFPQHHRGGGTSNAMRIHDNANQSRIQIQEIVNVNIVAAFGFSREVILAFKSNDLDKAGKRGTLIFTGATSSTRGNVVTSAFSAGKHGLRALSQSLAKEFGKENIHVAHVRLLL